MSQASSQDMPAAGQQRGQLGPLTGTYRRNDLLADSRTEMRSKYSQSRYVSCETLIAAAAKRLETGQAPGRLGSIALACSGLSLT